MHNPGLPFSATRHAGGFVFLSGELPLAPDGTIPEGIEAQTCLALERVAAKLASADLSLADVVQVNVILTHADDFNAFNAAYLRHFSAPYPTRTTLVAGLVISAARVEITATAAERRAQKEPA